MARSEGPATPGGTTPLGDKAIAAEEEVSPFSRTGLGIRERAIKPELVHYGGNIVVTDVGIRPTQQSRCRRDFNATLKRWPLIRNLGGNQFRRSKGGPSRG